MQKNVIHIKGMGQAWIDAAQSLHTLYGWKPVMWIAPLKPTVSEIRKCFEDIVYYDQADARKGAPPKELPGLPPATIDADLLRSLSKHEPIVFEMMTRWFISGGEKVGWDERRHFYYKLLRIWSAILSELKIDIVICGSIPHRIFDYIIYMLCQEMGITFLMIEQTSFPHISYGISTLKGRSRSISKAMDNLGDDFALDELTESYLLKAHGNYEEAMPSYFKEKVVKKQSRSHLRRLYDSLPDNIQFIAVLAKNALHGRLFTASGKMYYKDSGDHNKSDIPAFAKHYQMLNWQRKCNIRVSRTERWYNKNAVGPDYSRPYIYFAAPLQPERSTCPDAGVYFDLHLILDVLSKALPEGWVIYYKEHPSTFRRPFNIDNAINIRSYERIRRIPNCIFIDYKEDPFKMIDHSMATASARGTTAWEGMMRGIPAITFGNWWYNDCDGIFSVRTLDDCKSAMAKILSGYKPDQNKIRKYLAALKTVGLDLEFWRDTNVSLDDMKKNDPGEYKKKIELLAKVLADEYFRVTDQSRLLVGKGQNQ